jgi:hypothetical protein
MGKLYTIDKDDVLTYTFNWGWNLADGETITAKTLTASGGCVAGASAITAGSKAVAGTAVSVPSGAVTVVVSAPTGIDGTITCHITTSLGNQIDDYMDFRVTGN